MEKQIKAVLFDMDGTIIHSLKQWDLIISLVVGSKNIKKYRLLREGLSDKSMKGTCSILREHFGFMQSDTEICDLFERIAYEVFFNIRPKFIPGFVKFHSLLMQAGITPVLITNAPNYSLNSLKKLLSLERYFEGHVYNSCAVNYQFKPNPAIYLYALEKLGIEPDECIVFEDTIRGFEAAANAGITRIISVNGEISQLPIKRIKNYTGIKLCDL